MKKLFIFCFSVCLCKATSLAAYDVSETALTRSCKPLINENYKPASRGSAAVSFSIGRIMAQATELVQQEFDKNISQAEQERQSKENLRKAIAMLQEALQKADKDFDKASLNLILGSFVYMQSQNPATTLPYFKRAYDLGKDKLLYQRLQILKIQLAYFNFMLNRKREALKFLEDWLKTSNTHDPNAYFLLAYLYNDETINKPKKALCANYFAVKTSSVPVKAHLSFLAYLHQKLEDVPGVAIVLKDGIRYFPEHKDFWKNLSSAYAMLEKNADALSTSEALYLQKKFDKADDYKMLSQMFSLNNIPYRAAMMLEEGVDKNIVKANEDVWRNIAQNYYFSNEYEKAIKAYSKLASISRKSKDFFTLGNLYLETKNWKNAITAYNKVISDRNYDKRGQAFYNKAHSLYKLDECQLAIEELKQAAKYSKLSANSAQYINFIRDRIEKGKC